MRDAKRARGMLVAIADGFKLTYLARHKNGRRPPGGLTDLHAQAPWRVRHEQPSLSRRPTENYKEDRLSRVIGMEGDGGAALLAHAATVMSQSSVRLAPWRRLIRAESRAWRLDPRKA
jgi:hypothetical protein